MQEMKEKLGWKMKPKDELSLEEMVASDRGRAWGAEYVKYYGGLREDGDYRSQEAIDGAIANLRRFDVVGQLERLKEFHADVKASTGLRLITFRRNRSPVSDDERRALMSEEVGTAVEDLCAPDRAVWGALRR